MEFEVMVVEEHQKTVQVVEEVEAPVFVIEEQQFIVRATD